jgi:hypothetical protein
MLGFSSPPSGLAHFAKASCCQRSRLSVPAVFQAIISTSLRSVRRSAALQRFKSVTAAGGASEDRHIHLHFAHIIMHNIERRILYGSMVLCINHDFCTEPINVRYAAAGVERTLRKITATSESDRYCCKSRKSNGTQNLAKVDF